jgi:hypothetical protein
MRPVTDNGRVLSWCSQVTWINSLAAEAWGGVLEPQMSKLLEREVDSMMMMMMMIMMMMIVAVVFTSDVDQLAGGRGVGRRAGAADVKTARARGRQVPPAEQARERDAPRLQVSGGGGGGMMRRRRRRRRRMRRRRIMVVVMMLRFQ